MSENRFWNLLSKKLAGEASPEELAELEQLVTAHPELVYTAEQIEKLWKLKPVEPGSVDAEIAFEQHLENLKHHGILMPELYTPLDNELSFDSSRPRRRRKRLAGMLSAALVLGAAFFAWVEWSGSDDSRGSRFKNMSEVSTRPGSKTRLVLRDSTVVWLNAGSRLSFDENFGITNRNTTLTGEAFFEVKKAETPFIIQAGSVRIRVLGTSFNVKCYPNEKTTETSLIEGRLEISLDKRPDLSFTLKPNEKLVVANDQEEKPDPLAAQNEPKVMLAAVRLANDSSIIETSWVDNKLIFQDESFEEVARKMERWYGVTIDFRDEKLLKERLSGTITTETIQQALEALQITTPFHFTIKSNQITITKN